MKYFKFAILGLFFITALTFMHSGKAAAETPFNYTNYLMENNIFQADGTMTGQQIQTFLEQEGSGLAFFSDIENCGSPSAPNYAFYATYYSCGHQASAAQIIYAASQAYGINPQVILATMEKEQSLITTPNPTASQLNYAMGYGCPDSGSCGYAGFFNQVDNGTWQFRADFNLSSGLNYWGYTPSSYPCNGPTRYYSAALVPGNDVTFYDDYGTGYANFLILNASIGTLYCYTPHVYPGSAAEYYSGSKNFVYYFNLWFVPYLATYYNQSANPWLQAGQSAASTIEYTNTGNTNWYDDTDAVANGSLPVHLAVGNPVNSGSPFSYGWPSAGRPALTFSAVYDSDGVTLAPNQHVVTPGEIAQFSFNITVPWGFNPGTYRLYLQPVLEGAANWNMNGVAWFNVNVLPTLHLATYYNQSANPWLQAGQSAASTIEYTNTGNTNWYDDTDAVANGSLPVHLAVGNPVNSGSPFSYGWPSAGRPALTFSAVYDSDGVTLAPNQHVVTPGEIAQFSFNITVPWGFNPGTYRLYLQPVLEGAANWNMNGVAWFNVNVLPTLHLATYYNQSANPWLQAGQSAASTIEYTNTGNTNWYDDTDAVANGSLPVHLAVGNPVNSGSPFSYGWPSAGRPALTFSAVYDSDGVTLAPNQHVVTPGEIAQFSFNITVPWGFNPGTYRLYLQPVLEGAANWNMNGVAWFNVNVY